MSPEDPLELLARHRPTRPLSPLRLGPGDKLRAQALVEATATNCSLVNAASRIHRRQATCRPLHDAYLMPRRASLAAQEHAALQGGIRAIRSGERPTYRVLPAVDSRWYVPGYPSIRFDANDRRSAVEATRAAVADWLGVEPDAFEVVS